jgi:hypothetical protein
MANENEIRQALADAIRTVLSDEINVCDFFPKSPPPSPSLVIQRAVPTADLVQAMNSPTAAWRFVVMLLVSQVNEEAAQLKIGDLISPGSPIIEALNAVGEDTGFMRVKVTDVSESEVQYATTMYAYGRFSVNVLA